MLLITAATWIQNKMRHCCIYTHNPENCGYMDTKHDEALLHTHDGTDAPPCRWQLVCCGRFDLAALCGCRTFNVCYVMLITVVNALLTASTSIFAAAAVTGSLHPDIDSGNSQSCPRSLHCNLPSSLPAPCQPHTSRQASMQTGVQHCSQKVITTGIALQPAQQLYNALNPAQWKNPCC